MKTHYDTDADALYLRFANVPVSESEEVRPGIVFDFDSEGRIVAIEIPDATEHLASGADLKRLTAAIACRDLTESELRHPGQAALAAQTRDPS